MEELAVFEKERNKYLLAKKQLQYLSEVKKKRQQIDDQITVTVESLSMLILKKWRAALGVKKWSELDGLSKEDIALAAKEKGLHVEELKDICEECGHPLEAAEKLLIPIGDLDLSVRSYNCLNRAGYRNVADILAAGDELKKVRNLGQKSLKEILTIIAAL